MTERASASSRSGQRGQALAEMGLVICTATNGARDQLAAVGIGSPDFVCDATHSAVKQCTLNGENVVQVTTQPGREMRRRVRLREIHGSGSDHYADGHVSRRIGIGDGNRLRRPVWRLLTQTDVGPCGGG